MNHCLTWLALSASISAAGCYHHTFQTPDVTPQSQPAVDGWHHHVIFGLADVSGSYDLKTVCPNGVARIDNKHGFLNYIVAFLTFSIYTPTTVTIWCAADASGAQYPLYLLLPNGEFSPDEGASEIARLLGASEALGKTDGATKE
jgi:hypothetical protein